MAQQFNTSTVATYDISPDGTTTITHDITIRNITSDFYATSYTLSLTSFTPINSQASQNGQNIPVKISKNNDTASIEVNFPDEVVGKGNSREFTISFLDKTLVNKTGEIWEITTPRLGDSQTFDNYANIIRVPTSFGNLAYISPSPTREYQQNGQKIFEFTSGQNSNLTISAAFGNFQVFTFNLTYHLENPLNEKAQTQIALPPDTSYQKMTYTAIDPKPTNVTIDKDGNWIANYILNPHQKVDVAATGAVQIFASSLSVPKTNYDYVTSNLQPTPLWQVDDPKIQALAKKLKTPQAIYNYVTHNLTYDYNKPSAAIKRLGALNALTNPQTSLCTEFTDLFVSLARAAGIPAREIEGYAYTENQQIQPLSLVADVLHAWPQYWDEKSQSWISIDPTWEATSGIDYFNKLDLRHFTFAIHGTDPAKPYPAGSYKSNVNPQKDVNVAFGPLPSDRRIQLKVTNNVVSQLPFSDEIITTRVTNNSPIAVYNTLYQLNFDNKSSKSLTIYALPPYGYYETRTVVPYSFLGQKTPTKGEILLNGQQINEFTTYKTFVTITNLLMLFLFVFFIIFVIYLKFKDATRKQKISLKSPH